LRGGERILVTRLRDVQSRVESLPGVRKANVHRVLPTTVVIQVTEREPLVRLDGQPQLAADDSGTLFPAPDGVSTPLLQGWRGRAAEGRRLDGGSRALLRAFAAFPRELRTAAQLRAGDDIVLTMGDGLQIRFGRLNAMGAKAAAAQAVLQDARAAGVPLEYIDVRAPRTPVVGSRQTPAPTAKPGTPKPATPKPATPRPATPKPSSGH
jgi:cell division septal protein FtsQ